MRILVIHNRYQQPGGEDEVFKAERILLIENGHEVEILEFDNNSARTWAGKAWMMATYLYNPRSARLINRKIKDFRPDVVHVHNFIFTVSPAVFWVAHRNKVPVVLTLHNYRLLCPGATLFHNGSIYTRSVNNWFPIDAVARGIYRDSKLLTAAVAGMTAIHFLLGTWQHKIDRYIVLTNFAAGVFARSRLQKITDRFIVKYNFVQDYGPGEKRRKDFFVFAGRLTPEKGILTLLHSAAADKFNLTIAGDGPLRPMVEEWAARFPNIIYVGYQSKPEVIGLIKQCRALIFPSEWFEGLPLTILEAFATGTPVIASRLGSMNEIVVDGMNGLHFQAGSAADLSCAVTRISQDAALADRLSDHARKDYLAKYSPEVNYRKLISIYSEVIAEKREDVLPGRLLETSWKPIPEIT